MKQRSRRNPISKDPVATKIENLSHEGRGIATIENKKTFIQGALPGEEIEFIYTAKKAQLAEGIFHKLISEPSPDRVEPKCRHFTICGGCQLQHMTDAKQLALKQATLQEQLLHFGKIIPAQIILALSGESYGYRRKARLGVRYVIKKEKLLIGFRERDGRFLADLEQCEVLHPSVGYQLQALTQLIMQLSCYTEIPQIEIAVGDDHTALIIRHMVPLTAEDLTILKIFAQEKSFHIYLQPGKPSSIHALWPENCNRLHYKIPAFNLTMAFHPNDFVQVNQEMNLKLIDLALNLLDPQKNEIILDLFCGLGNFSLPLATKCAKVIGVEGDAQMVERARENSKNNSLENTEFYAADLTQPFKHFPWSQYVFDKILIDPPRSGALEIIQQITAFNAKKIVYVSCNPATLARDAEHLVAQNYKLSAAGIINMFPHTGHVESIALFERI